MHIIAKGTLERYGKRHATALEPLRSWHQLVADQEWTTPNELKKQFPIASIINDKRVVFNIKGNAYRLIVDVVYKKPKMKHGIVFIVKVMTHAEYDKVDVTELSYEG